MIKETPEISPKELAVQLNIPLGEAVVLLDEIRGSKTHDHVVVFFEYSKICYRSKFVGFQQVRSVRLQEIYRLPTEERLTETQGSSRV